MSKAGGFVLGDWNAQCDECGQYFLASKMRKRWDGAFVDQKCFELRNPQDFVRSVKDGTPPPWTRPFAVDNIAVYDNNALGSAGIGQNTDSL
jgi:hypothetical protein